MRSKEYRGVELLLSLGSNTQTGYFGEDGAEDWAAKRRTQAWSDRQEREVTTRDSATREQSTEQQWVQKVYKHARASLASRNRDRGDYGTENEPEVVLDAHEDGNINTTGETQ